MKVTALVNQKLLVAATAIFLGLEILGTAKAEAITVFTDRAAWQAETTGNPVFFEDFEGFVSDTEFRTTTVNASGFSLKQLGIDESFRNEIDALPIQFLTNSNGTNNASLYTNFGATTVEMVLNSPISAWGADFFSAATSESVDLILDIGGGSIQVTIGAGFFGFVTSPDQSFSKLTFVSRIDSSPGGEGFGLDNVTGANAIPTPALLPGLIGMSIAALRKRNK